MKGTPGHGTKSSGQVNGPGSRVEGLEATRERQELEVGTEEVGGGPFVQMRKGSKIPELGGLNHIIGPMAHSWVAGEKEPRSQVAPGGWRSGASPSALRGTLGPQGCSHVL